MVLLRLLITHQVVLVPHNPVQPVAWLVYQQLNQYPHQASVVRRVARNPAGLKTKPVKGQTNQAWGQWPSSKNAQQNMGDGVT